MSQARNLLKLSGDLVSDSIRGSSRDIDPSSKFTKGRVDGNDSFYVIYPEPNYMDDEPDSQRKSKVIKTSAETEIGFVARSAQGWNKEGISLFEHRNFCGTGETYKSSNEDITSTFPPGKDEGLSSFIVWTGIWSVYKDKNYGLKININGKDEFGPGTQICVITGAANDLIKSIKLVRD